MYLLIGGLVSAYSTVYAADEFSGQYLATLNLSTQEALMPSLNNRLAINYSPTWMQGNLDFRIENYTENSYHTDNGDMVRERKFETQLNYNYRLTDKLNATAGLLRHENYTFRDNYYWAIAGLMWNGNLTKDTSLAATLLAEKRDDGGRVFYDTSGTIEHHFMDEYGIFFAAHIYENLGEFDLKPTHKYELETGVNYYISKRYFAAISYFYHQQIDDPADRFSFLKFKLGVNF